MPTCQDCLFCLDVRWSLRLTPTALAHQGIEQELPASPSSAHCALGVPMIHAGIRALHQCPCWTEPTDLDLLSLIVAQYARLGRYHHAGQHQAVFGSAIGGALPTEAQTRVDVLSGKHLASWHQTLALRAKTRGPLLSGAQALLSDAHTAHQQMLQSVLGPTSGPSLSSRPQTRHQTLWQRVFRRWA